MGISEWIRDLQSLASERRGSDQRWYEQSQELKAAVAELEAAERSTSRKASFYDRCQQLVSMAQGMPAETPEGGMFADLFRGKQVLDVVDPLFDDAREITNRLALASSSLGVEILAEYGLRSSASIDQPRLAKMSKAIDDFCGRADRLMPVSTWEDCRIYAADAAKALERFLHACR